MQVIYFLYSEISSMCSDNHAWILCISFMGLCILVIRKEFWAPSIVPLAFVIRKEFWAHIEQVRWVHESNLLRLIQNWTNLGSILHTGCCSVLEPISSTWMSQPVAGQNLKPWVKLQFFLRPLLYLHLITSNFNMIRINVFWREAFNRSDTFSQNFQHFWTTPSIIHF